MLPPSQKNREVGFYLSGGGGSTTFNLPIRPEDLTRSEPSRVNAIQTLGGAWVDAFGAGVRTVTLAGHTGWRGSFGESGEDAFKTLRDTVFVEWHKRRETLMKSGQDPGEVHLTFVDALNGITSLVVPRSFQLRRSKSSPLLLKYQISLIELGDASEPGDALDALLGGLANPVRWVASALGLEGVVSALTDGLAFVKWVADEVKSFTKTVIGIIGQVVSVARSTRGYFDSTVGTLLYSGLALASAGRDAFRALASVTDGASSIRQQLMRMGSLFNEAVCLMRNGFNLSRRILSFDDLFGASNCSSTAGGRPASQYTAAGQNPLATLYPPVPARVVVSPAAQQAIQALTRDPLVAPPDPASIARSMGAIAAGVQVAA